MRYRIVTWKWNKDIELNDRQYPETKKCRRIKFNSWISLLTENEWTHLESDNDIFYNNVIDAQIAYDNELKKLGLSDWKELEEKKYYDELNAAKAEIEFFKNKGNSKLFELKESGYIYFLFKDGIIVYVGQTYSLATKRPYAHTDKSYDKIMVYEVEDKTQLNALESYLIYKLNPFYNNHPGQYGQDKLKNVLMLMENDKLKNEKNK
jgi:hypothetical protein